MSPNLIFYSGIGICGIAVLGAAIGSIVLRIWKKRLEQALDDAYGKRRQ